MTGDAECGYVFHAGLVDALNTGKKQDLIDLVISAETTLADVSNEVVYAELFEEYSLAILTDYLLTDSVLENPSTSEIESLYRENMVNGSTFAFDYSGSYSSYHGIRSGLSSQVLKGLCSILILLGGFLGLLNYCGSAEAQIYCAVTKNGRKFLLFAELFPPVLLMTLAAVFSLFCRSADRRIRSAQPVRICPARNPVLFAALYDPAQKNGHSVFTAVLSARMYGLHSCVC